MKTDIMMVPGSIWTPQSESVCDRGVRHKLVLCCSPNPACVNPFPFRSSPWFLSNTRVHGSPQSKYDEHELRSELTWWLRRWAWARVIGPAMVGGDGVDVSLAVMSSSGGNLFSNTLEVLVLQFLVLIIPHVLARSRRKMMSACTTHIFSIIFE